MTVTGPIDPYKEVQNFLIDKKDEQSDGTIRNYRSNLNRWLEWCDENSFEDTTELTGRKANAFIRQQKTDSSITLMTAANQAKTLRVFVKYGENNDSVPIGVSDQIAIPNISRDDEKADDRALDPDRADAILEYLEKFEYASSDHLLFGLLSDMGCRMGAIRGLDVDDVKYRDDGKMYVDLQHRPDTDTPLKRGENGQRHVLIGLAVSGMDEVVEGYIENRRADVEDQYGRNPLVTTNHGRITRGTFRNRLYGVTRPCVTGDGCPMDKDPQTREFMAHGQRSKCPSTHAPHSVRHAYVTRMRDNDDIPDYILGDRIDMSPDTMEKYYDERDESERMNQRERIMGEALNSD